MVAKSIVQGKHMTLRRTAGLLLLALPGSALAVDELEAPPPPPPAETVEAPGGVVDPADAEQFKPEVTIIRRDREVVEEYRINGVLYKVKVTPSAGPPYYLLYPDGPQGKPVRRELGEMQTPHWVIFSW